MPTKTFVRSQDTIFFYTRSGRFTFNRQYEPYGKAQLSRFKRDKNGRLYTGRDLTFSTGSKARQFEWRGAKPPANRSWGYSLEELERLWQEGRILKKKDGIPRLDGLVAYLDELPGKPLTTIWNDVNRVGNTARERLDYPTQKPEGLLERTILALIQRRRHRSRRLRRLRHDAGCCRKARPPLDRHRLRQAGNLHHSEAHAESPPGDRQQGTEVRAKAIHTLQRRALRLLETQGTALAGLAVLRVAVVPVPGRAAQDRRH